MWDAVGGGNQIQSITLQQSGGAPTNRITSVTTNGTSTVNYSYDAAGNVTNDGLHAYAYDSENRIVSVDGGSTASYAYDQQNRRYKKTVGSTVTHYVWQGSQALAEHNGGTGAVLIDYVYSGSRVIATVASGSTQYSLSDRLSVRLSLDSSGNVLGRQSHLPFGEDFGESGLQQKHHYTSYERDSEAGTDYSLNRQYLQTAGRFNRADPLASSAKKDYPQSWNRYSYTENEPVGGRDPNGLHTEWGSRDPFAPASQIPPPVLLPWEMDPCDPQGATVLLDGLEMSSGGMMCMSGAIPSPRDFIDPLLPGQLWIDGDCPLTAFMPENGRSGHLEDWVLVGLFPNTVFDVDFVATPRGVVKIPNGCNCTMTCAGLGVSYEIVCDCAYAAGRGLGGLLGADIEPRLVTDADYPHALADPRKRFSWIGSGSPYTRSRDGWDYVFN